ncbi:SDR family NAD(P)-dependent oxidoreductase [Actinoplanes sp. NPDC048791]|uniref:SDR family NAD(P)-dependent oxidoreductase n=1 Tax=Actinoplanes sp. NPDC048791 TaxID=3154623 RepID=UPI0033D5EAEE
MGRRVLMTGARRGIGAAIAVDLAAPGWTLLLHHLDALEEAKSVAQQCRDRGAQAQILEADLADPAAVFALANQAGPVDILINNASRASNVAFDALSLDEWQETFAVNVTAPMLLAQSFGAGMAERGWGRIVNVTSATVALGGPSGPSYVASKAALVGLTRSLARSFGPAGVTVNALSPGAILTEREREILGDDPHPGLVAAQAVPRPLVPADLLTAVRFLVADGSGAMTGQVVEVGGGLVLG